MPLLTALAMTFQVTEFDILVLGGIFLSVILLYYFVTLHHIFEAAFGAIVGMGIYLLLMVLLVGNPALGTEGVLFPFGFAVFLVSIAIYLVFLLAILFPLHGGLVVSEPTQPLLYTITYIGVATYLLFALGAICIYCIDQVYIFKVQTFLTWFHDATYYTEVVKKSWFYSYTISHQNTIIPLGVVLMLYKLLLSNLVNAAILSIWYNLSHVGFYRSKDDTHYRVEFHEVGGKSGSHEDTHSTQSNNPGSGGHDENTNAGHGHH